MPSPEAAEFIAQSLAQNELRVDFEFMLDELTRLRQPFHDVYDVKESERGAGRLLCLLVTPKPKSYVEAMQRFRLLFGGIAERPALQMLYYNSILPAALYARVDKSIEFRPSLYFNPLPGLLYRQDPDLTGRYPEPFFFVRDWPGTAWY